MNERMLLQSFDAILLAMFNHGMGRNGLELDFSVAVGEQFQNTDLEAVCLRMQRFLACLNESYCFAEELAKGHLDGEASRGNPLVMPLKALQANLRHLSWQALQVAKGDLSQRVHFLGAFSEAFNQMIASLREKAQLEEQMQTITDSLGEGVLLMDLEGRLIFMNPEAQRLLGYSEDEMREKVFWEAVQLPDKGGPETAFQGNALRFAIQEGREYRNDDAAFLRKSGDYLPVSLVCRPVRSDNGASGAVLAFSDMTQQKKHLESLKSINQALEKQASTDALTGLMNRVAFSRLFGVELQRSQRYESPLSIILLDIDNFKDVNDTFGHLSGDDVLKELASLIGTHIRGTDVAARWGGEEFIIMAPGITLLKGVAFAQKLRQIIATHKFPVPRKITSSFGVSAFTPGDTETTLTNRTDQALYRAKHMGRNRVEAIE